MTAKNIDTILVNPSDTERVKSAFLSNGLEKFANMIVPCVYVTNGQILVFNSKQLMHLDFKIGGEQDE